MILKAKICNQALATLILCFEYGILKDFLYLKKSRNFLMKFYWTLRIKKNDSLFNLLNFDLVSNQQSTGQKLCIICI